MKCLQVLITFFYFTIIFGINVSAFRKGRKYERPLDKRGPMSYVVERGCPYLTHYVRDNYFSLVDNKRTTTVSTATAANINWVKYVYDMFVENYVPLELFHGLVSCGKTFALYAIDPPKDIVNLLNANFTIIPGVGK